MRRLSKEGVQGGDLEQDLRKFVPPDGVDGVDDDVIESGEGFVPIGEVADPAIGGEDDVIDMIERAEEGGDGNDGEIAADVAEAQGVFKERMEATRNRPRVAETSGRPREAVGSRKAARVEAEGSGLVLNKDSRTGHRGTHKSPLKEHRPRRNSPEVRASI